MINYGKDPDADMKLLLVRRMRWLGNRPNLDEWEASPFVLLRTAPNRNKSAIVVDAVLEWLGGQAAGEIEAEIEKGVAASIWLDDKRVMVRMSMRWYNGYYVFQQLGTGSDNVLLVGISPQDIHMWFVPANKLLAHARQQHKPDGGMWLKFRADEPPDWLAEFGGTPSNCLDAIIGEG